MKCYNHNEASAVAACLDCGKGLCGICADAYEKPYCERCATQINAEITENNINVLRNNFSIYRNTVIKKMFGIAWNAFFMFMGINSFIYEYNNGYGEALSGLIIGWGIAGLPWVFTSGIMTKKGNTVLIQTAGQWLIGAIIKLMVGFIIGAIAAPILLVISIVITKKSITGMRESKKQLADIN